MADSFHLKALGECKREFERTMREISESLETRVHATQYLIDVFAQKFEEDFKEALTPREGEGPSFPEQAWRLTRRQILLKVRAIAALAVAHALDEKSDELTEAHLRKATLAVKPDCETSTHHLEFCAGFQAANARG